MGPILPNGDRVGSFRQNLVRYGDLRLIIRQWLPTKELELSFPDGCAL